MRPRQLVIWSDMAARRRVERHVEHSLFERSAPMVSTQAHFLGSLQKRDAVVPAAS